tara:strand:+ start:120 stop:893 length:774 start_codon:yes stop_codon:yes gene_type:complete
MISKSKIKHLSSLKQKKYRKESNEYIIEGIRTVNSAIESKTKLKSIFWTKKFADSVKSKTLIKKIKKNKTPIFIVEKNIIKKITNTLNPSGVLALCPILETNKNIKDFIGPGLYLDTISDPGNLGTILRTAAWFGIRNIIISKNSVELNNPKVIRGGMGAHFYLKFFNLSLEALKENNYKIIGSETYGDPVDDFKLGNQKNWILLFGSEACGISEKNKKYLSKTISIPKYGHGESLNVAVSVGILLSSFSRSSFSVK